MDRPRRAVDGVRFVIRFWTDRMYGFRDIAIFRFCQFGLKMPSHAPFGWVFGGTFPPNNVTHHPNPKRTVLGTNHVIWAIKRELSGLTGRWRKTKEQDSTGKKVTKKLYFTYLWRSPHWSDIHQKLCSTWPPRRNHLCQVSKWNFQGLPFYRGVEFSIFLSKNLMGLTTVQHYFAACDFGFATPQKAHSWGNGVFWRILRQNPCGRLGCRWSEEPTPQKIAESTLVPTWREIGHAQKRNPYPIWIKLCRVVGIPNVITYTNLGDDRLRGLVVVGVKRDQTFRSP